MQPVLAADELYGLEAQNLSFLGKTGPNPLLPRQLLCCKKTTSKRADWAGPLPDWPAWACARPMRLTRSGRLSSGKSLWRCQARKGNKPPCAGRGDCSRSQLRQEAGWDLKDLKKPAPRRRRKFRGAAAGQWGCRPGLNRSVVERIGVKVGGIAPADQGQALG